MPAKTEYRHPKTLQEAVDSTATHAERFAQKWYGKFHMVPLEDLVSATGVGTIQAWRRFDPKMKNKFMTYAAWWWRKEIREEIKRHIAFGMPCIPGKGLRFAGVMHESAIQEQGEITQTHHSNSFSGSHHPLMLSMEEPEPPDLPPVFDEIKNSTLSPFQCRILIMRYRDGLRMREIAARLGRKSAITSHNHQVALEKLRTDPTLIEMWEAMR